MVHLPTVIARSDVATVLASRGGSGRLVAIDGLPCAGKSTLADMLLHALDASCLSFDDFVRPLDEWPVDNKPSYPFPFMRHDEFVEAIRSLALKGECRFRQFDWATRSISPTMQTIRADRDVIIEGIGALSAELCPLYAVKLYVRSDRSTALGAAMARGGESLKREWRDLILPSADLYMRTRPQDRADFVVSGRGA